MELSKPKLVYVAYEYPAKTQTFVTSEAAAMAMREYDVHFYAVNRGDRSGRYKESFKVIDRVGGFRNFAAAVAAGSRNLRNIMVQFRLPPHTLRSRLRFFKSLFHALRLAMYIRELESIVHVHAHFFGVMSEVAILAKQLSPSVATTSIAGHASDVYSPPSRQRLAYEAEVVDFVACASQSISDALSSTGTSATTVLVRCGVKVPQFVASSRPAGECAMRVVTVARLVEKKGLDDCISACALLVHRTDRPILWTVVGEGPMREYLEDRARSCGLTPDVFRLVGHEDHQNVQRILATECDVFVLPCRTTASGDVDGIPVALMEAMAASRPVVTTPVGGIAELVLDRFTGFIVPERDPRSIADVLVVIFNDLEACTDGVGRRARQFVETHFDQSAQAKVLDNAISAAGLRNLA